MDNPSDRHPDEETLESYAMGKVRGAALARTEEHLLVCADCQDRLADLDGFLAAMREAAIGLLDSLSHTHATSDGPVQLLATRLPRQQWLARFQGQELEGQCICESLLQAYDFLRTSFSEMYPEHSCTSLCRKNSS